MKQKQSGRPIVVAVTSDLHSGSTLGLCPPVVELPEGGSYRTKGPQRWLWHKWLDYCEQVKATTKQHKAKLVVVLNGDMAEGNHHHTRSVIAAGNETVQKRIAETCLGKLLEFADEVYFTKGTDAHVKKQAALEEAIADNWTMTRPMHEGAAVWDIVKFSANGTRFNIAHHGKVGRLLHTKLNPLGNLAISAELRGYRRYGKPPHVVIRSHMHQYVDTNDNYPVRVIQAPAWQLTTEFVNRINPDEIADIGGLIFTCYPGGRHDCQVVRYKPKTATIARIEV